MRGVLLALFGLGMLQACATDPLPPREWSTTRALATWGTALPTDLPATPRVVIIADRHPVSGKLGRDRGPLERVRHENQRAVQWLVERGYRLLGCEFRLGPLPRVGRAENHRRYYRQLWRSGANLNRYNLYQPIRYEMSFPERLTVLGVEDPELYDADVAALDQLLAIAREVSRYKPGLHPQKAILRKERASLVRQIEARCDARGRAAAENLLALMQRRGEARAILVIGAAHVEAARDGFLAQGITPLVFRCAGLDQPRHAEPAP